MAAVLSTVVPMMMLYSGSCPQGAQVFPPKIGESGMHPWEKNRLFKSDPFLTSFLVNCTWNKFCPVDSKLSLDISKASCYLILEDHLSNSSLPMEITSHPREIKEECCRDLRAVDFLGSEAFHTFMTNRWLRTMATWVIIFQLITMFLLWMLFLVALVVISTRFSRRFMEGEF